MLDIPLTDHQPTDCDRPLAAAGLGTLQRQVWRVCKGRDIIVKHRMAFGAATILAAVSMPALAANLVTNGGFEDNFGAGQFNQALPGSAGGQSANHPGTTAEGWTVTGTNASFPDGYAFVFKNNNSFTTSNGHVGPPSGARTRAAPTHCRSGAIRATPVPRGTTSTGSIRPITHRRSRRKSAASSSAIPIRSPSTTPPRSSSIRPATR